MLKRHEVQVLRRAGHTWKEIAALSGVSVRTVRRIAAETEITTIDNAAERARREVGRPAKAASATPHGGPARHAHQVAPSGLAAPLEVEIAARTAADSEGRTATDCEHGPGEPNLG